MTIVIDASIALTWCFEDEATAETDALADRVRKHGALVPALWHLEVGNALLHAEKRGRIMAADVANRLGLIDALPIAVDHQTSERAWREILFLARSEGLTTYDAAYLELALRRGASLGTLDTDLAKAARDHGLTTLP